MAESEALTCAAQEAAEAGDFEAAVAAFRRAAAQAPDSAAVNEQLAQCLSELGRDEEALAAVELCTRSAPNWPPGWLTQARVEANLGSLGRALSCYARCSELGGEAEAPELPQEVREAEALWEQQVARRVGLPGLRIQQQLGSAAGPGAVVWEAGLCLGEFLTHHLARWLRGKRLLELGSGTGVAGLAAARLGAEVLLTDRPPLLPLLRLNAQRSGCPGAAVAALDWDGPPPFSALAGRAFHGVLLADPVYAPRQIPGLLAVLRAVLGSNPHARLLLAHKHRHEAVDAALLAGVEALLGCRLRACAVSSVDSRVRVFDSRGRLQALRSPASALPEPLLEHACAGGACGRH